jgi:hypothetical protein
MKVAVMQPYLFPYIGYFQLVNHSDTFVFYDDVNFIKGGYINRNNILMNGNGQRFTWPITGASSFKKINELDFTTNNKKVIATIKQAYSKAPFFQDVFPIIESVLSTEDLNVATVCEKSIWSVMSYLGIDKNFIKSSELIYNRELPAQDKLFEICELNNAKEYTNSPGGQALYTKSAFKNKGIELNFIKNQAKPYNQSSSEFIPNLSIIDVLMWNSVEDVCLMLNEYEVI